ncbi:MAG: hypothetical protein O9256_00905 [Rhizobiaceae bacterium]|nr:hypothetical protein [Rhizobiaceae bacterium]
MYLHAYLPANIDAPELSFNLSKDRPVVIGRVGRAPHRLEPLLGCAVVAQAIGLNRPIDALVLSLEDQEALVLRHSDLSGANVVDVVAAYRILRKSGVSGALAAKALGVSRKDEASRLAAVAKLDQRILDRAAFLGMTLHHLRWASGKPAESVLSALEHFSPRCPTVAAFKAAMGGMKSDRATQVLTSESDRLAEWLGARAQVIWDGQGGSINLTYYSPEELIGLFERLTEKPKHAPVSSPAEARTLSLPFRNLAEYEYLVGGGEHD